MTVARVSQVTAEVIRTNTAPAARVSQVTVEVLRINTATVIRTSQVTAEVIRKNAPEIPVETARRKGMLQMIMH